MALGVYFDLDGTLLSYERPFEELFVGTIRDGCGVEPPEGAFERYVDRLLGAISAVERNPYEAGFEAIIRDAGDGNDSENGDDPWTDADPRALADDYIDREIAATAVSDDALAVVKAVADVHPTGILTNGAGRVQRRKVEAHGLDEIVDAVVVSNDVGVRKPDPGIFAVAAARLPADEHLYIGDTFEEDILGARDAGWRAIHVRNDEGPSIVSVSAVSALGNVLDLGRQ